MYIYIHINVEFKGLKLRTHFSHDLLLIVCNIFPEVMVIYLYLIKHVSFGFNTSVDDISNLT